MSDEQRDASTAPEAATVGGSATTGVQPWTWDKGKTHAAELLAEGKLSDETIAVRVKRAPRTIAYWKTRPEFQARVQQHVEAFREKILAKGIAERQNRVDALREHFALLEQIRLERAASEAMDGVPGGATGLLVRQVKLVKLYKGIGDEPNEGLAAGETLVSAKREVAVEEFSLDTGLERARRETLKHIAQELGEWSEGKGDGNGGLLKLLDLSRLTTEQLEKLANGADPLAVLLGK